MTASTARLRRRLLSALALGSALAGGCFISTEDQEVECVSASSESCASRESYAAGRVGHPFESSSCSDKGTVTSVDDGPVFEASSTSSGGLCCYLLTRKKTQTPANVSFGCGRPLPIGDGLRVADLRRGGGAGAAWGERALRDSA